MNGISRPKGYVDPQYLETAARMIRHIKESSYACMQIRPGQKLLDVGCGPGTDTIPLSGLVGATGHVTGVDYDPAMIDEANRQAELAGVSGWVSHIHTDAAVLPFGPDEFDASRSERLFQHLLNPEQALAEMVRVVRPGGRIVVLDTDWGTASLDTSETDIERRLMRVLSERCLNNGYSGRRLYRLFKQQKLAEISVELCPVIGTDYPLTKEIMTLERTEQEALVSGVVSRDELERWHADLERAQAEGVFFVTAGMILVAGRKP